MRQDNCCLYTACTTCWCTRDALFRTVHFLIGKYRSLMPLCVHYTPAPDCSLCHPYIMCQLVFHVRIDCVLKVLRNESFASCPTHSFTEHCTKSRFHKQSDETRPRWRSDPDCSTAAVDTDTDGDDSSETRWYAIKQRRSIVKARNRLKKSVNFTCVCLARSRCLSTKHQYTFRLVLESVWCFEVVLVPRGDYLWRFSTLYGW